MHVACGGPGVKVFSAKFYFTPIRESFLPRKIPAIQYMYMYVEVVVHFSLFYSLSSLLSSFFDCGTLCM